MNTKIRIGIGIFCSLLASIIFVKGIAWYSEKNIQYHTITVHSGSIANEITADGTVHSAQEVSLHFQLNGKLTFLPVKEGDHVSSGQTIAQLDTYALEQQLAVALNQYRATRDSFDQTQENMNNGMLQGQQQAIVQGKNIGLPTTSAINDPTQQSTAVYDMVKRIADENQAALDNSVANVNLANYALQLSTLTAPFSGVLTHEDVTVPGQNITPLTSFALADPTQLVFRANVLASDSNMIALGSHATVRLAGSSATYSATVTRLYPQKITLPSGSEVYQVDLSLSGVSGALNLGKQGTAVFDSIIGTHSVLVPTWLILNHSSIWIQKGKNIKLQTVTVGNIYGNTAEITHGLSDGDVLITNPEVIIQNNYLFL